MTLPKARTKAGTDGPIAAADHLPWTPPEDLVLHQFVYIKRKAIDWEGAAEKIGRTVGAVKSRYKTYLKHSLEAPYELVKAGPDDDSDDDEQEDDKTDKAPPSHNKTTRAKAKQNGKHGEQVEAEDPQSPLTDPQPASPALSALTNGNDVAKESEKAETERVASSAAVGTSAGAVEGGGGAKGAAAVPGGSGGAAEVDETGDAPPNGEAGKSATEHSGQSSDHGAVPVAPSPAAPYGPIDAVNSTHQDEPVDQVMAEASDRIGGAMDVSMVDVSTNMIEQSAPHATVDDPVKTAPDAQSNATELADAAVPEAQGLKVHVSAADSPSADLAISYASPRSPVIEQSEAVSKEQRALSVPPLATPNNTASHPQNTEPKDKRTDGPAPTTSTISAEIEYWLERLYGDKPAEGNTAAKSLPPQAPTHGSAPASPGVIAQAPFQSVKKSTILETSSLNAPAEAGAPSSSTGNRAGGSVSPPKVAKTRRTGRFNSDTIVHAKAAPDGEISPDRRVPPRSKAKAGGSDLMETGGGGTSAGDVNMDASVPSSSLKQVTPSRASAAAAQVSPDRARSTEGIAAPAAVVEQADFATSQQATMHKHSQVPSADISAVAVPEVHPSDSSARKAQTGLDAGTSARQHPPSPHRPAVDPVSKKAKGSKRAGGSSGDERPVGVKRTKAKQIKVSSPEHATMPGETSSKGAAVASNDGATLPKKDTPASPVQRKRKDRKQGATVERKSTDLISDETTGVEAPAHEDSPDPIAVMEESGDAEQRPAAPRSPPAASPASPAVNSPAVQASPPSSKTKAKTSNAKAAASKDKRQSKKRKQAEAEAEVEANTAVESTAEASAAKAARPKRAESPVAEPAASAKTKKLRTSESNGVKSKEAVPATPPPETKATRSKTKPSAKPSPKKKAPEGGKTGRSSTRSKGKAADKHEGPEAEANKSDSTLLSDPDE